MKVLVVLLLVGFVSASPEPEGTVCDICKKGVSQLQGFLSDERVNKVKSVVNTVCPYVPFFDECADKVILVIDGVVSYIRDIDAHELCSRIGNCGDEDKPVPDIELVGDEESCNKCVARYEKIVAIIEQYPQVKYVIKKVLSSVCILPIENCSQIVEDVVEQAFKEFEMGANDLCTKIGQC